LKYDGNQRGQEQQQQSVREQQQDDTEMGIGKVDLAPAGAAVEEMEHGRTVTKEELDARQFAEVSGTVCRGEWSQVSIPRLWNLSCVPVITVAAPVILSADTRHSTGPCNKCTRAHVPALHCLNLWSRNCMPESTAGVFA
jgi:hypothetical protein